jgi:hypothetical protein
MRLATRDRDRVMKNCCPVKELPGTSGWNPAWPSRDPRPIPTEAKVAAMQTPVSVPFATTAILTLAEIKAAVERFDRGETNVFDALDAIIVAVDAHQAAKGGDVHRKDRRRDAA